MSKTTFTKEEYAQIETLVQQLEKALCHVSSQTSFENKGSKRENSDEYYVIDLCNKALGKTGLQQYRFDFLRGDSGMLLPVDVYYPDLNLVVEYYERQHSEEIKFFDRKMTVSGISRGEQRKIYDERRRTELPKHGIKVVIISFSDFGTSKRICRNPERDLEVVIRILQANKQPVIKK